MSSSIGVDVSVANGLSCRDPSARRIDPIAGIVISAAKYRTAVAALAAWMLVVASLTGCGGGMLSPDLVMVNGGEPPYPLIPTSTNDSNGGRIIDRLFAGLVSYDAAGNPSKEVAQSIETPDNVNYRIVLKPGWKFTDGSTVTAHSFVDAWNYGALSTNAQLQQSFFSPIEGFDEVSGMTGDGQPAPKTGRTTMSGLQ